MAKLWSFKEFREWQPTYPRELVGGGLIHEQTKAIMYGRYKSLKSMLGLNMGFAVSDGKPWLGLETTPTPVLYVQLEDPERLFHKRFTRMCDTWELQQGNHTLPLYFCTEPFLKLDRHDGFSSVKDLVEKAEPGLLILDPVYKLMSGNMLDATQVGVLLDAVDLLVSKYNLSVVLVHHPRKSSGMTTPEEAASGWGSDDLLGSVLFSAWADSVIKVTRRRAPDKEHELITVNFDVVRHAEETIADKEVLFDRRTLEFKVVDVPI